MIESAYLSCGREVNASPERMQKTAGKWAAWFKGIGDRRHIKDGHPGFSPRTNLARSHAHLNSLMHFAMILLALALQSALAQSTPEQTPAARPLMDREKEVALALSACPVAIASKAAVYVLGQSGYVKVRDTQNGFTAIVQHSLLTSQEPQCMDAEGTRTFLPRMLMVASLRAQGKSADEIKQAVAAALAKGMLQPPTRPGIDYMLSTENLVPDDNGVVSHFPPHVMFYGPYLTNADIGSEGQAAGGPAFVAGEGLPFALIIVPVAAHSGMAH